MDLTPLRTREDACAKNVDGAAWAFVIRISSFVICADPFAREGSGPRSYAVTA
jgi:hypothetical protein